MKKIIHIMFIIFTGLLLFIESSLAQENKKLAQTGMQFLSVESDARAAALAGAVTSTNMGSSSLFFNPACMANITQFVDLAFSQNQWIADINYNTFSMAVNPANGKYGVFGLSIQSVDYGEIQGTIVSNEQIGYTDTGILNPSAFAAGIGYARSLTDRFSIGGQIKMVRQNLGENFIPVTDSTKTKVENEISPVAFDFGTLYKTGFKSLVFGMSVRNFSQEMKYEEEGFQLPLVFAMGISMNLFDLLDVGGPEQSLYFSIDATHYRSHPEQLLFGLDYKIINLLSLRAGYVTNNDENDFSFGVGVSQYGFDFDYSYTPFGVFDSVKRITARFSI